MTFAQAVLAVAQVEVGNGEEGRNNRGPHIKRYRAHWGGRGAWCAAFVSYCMEQAADRLDQRCPVQRAHGAKRLFRRILRVGTDVGKDPTLTRPGDIVCWNRGKRGSWKGHIGIVVHPGDIITTIEGNVGRYPAKVRRFEHDVEYERLVGFARLP